MSSKKVKTEAPVAEKKSVGRPVVTGSARQARLAARAARIANGEKVGPGRPKSAAPKAEKAPKAKAPKTKTTEPVAETASAE
jgi:hypothetical protein